MKQYKWPTGIKMCSMLLFIRVMQILLGKLQIHMQKNEVSHITYKNQLKMYPRPECKRAESVNFLENIVIILQDVGFGNGFLGMSEKEINWISSKLNLFGLQSTS